MRIMLVRIFSIVCLFMSLPVMAEMDQASQDKGFAIVAESDRMDVGFKTSIAKLEMVLQNSAGQETTRSLEIKTLEKPNENVGDKSITFFFTPHDIEGTALLSHAKILESDDQWLYLPELARTKRISSANKSGPFVGSEFAFEDLTASELMKYDYTYLETSELGGLVVDVIKQVPRYERSGYSHLIAYYDQDIKQLRKVEYFNRGGQHFKTLTQEDFKHYGDTIYRPHVQRMENHMTGKVTTLNIQNYEFGAPLNENQFNPSSLERL